MAYPMSDYSGFVETGNFKAFKNSSIVNALKEPSGGGGWDAVREY
jgi:hypothetical protein